MTRYRYNKLYKEKYAYQKYRTKNEQANEREQNIPYIYTFYSNMLPRCFLCKETLAMSYTDRIAMYFQEDVSFISSVL